MKKYKHTHTTTFIICWLMLVLIACNLGTAPAAPPPTIVPQVTQAPVATLGYNGQGQQELLQPSNITTQVADVDVELFNLTEQIDVGRLRTHVEALQSFTTRHVNSSTSSPDYGIGAARSYIYNQFLSIQDNSGGRFTVPPPQTFDMTYAGVPTRQENILGVLQGTQPGAGFIIVGAHYDSINTDFGDATGFAPGANDNASGVAGVIEMARVMSQSQFRSSIIFVLFSAEEVDRVGSKQFVLWARSQGLDIAGMINIDSIGNNYNSASGVTQNSLRIFSCETENDCRDGGLSRHMARSMEVLGFQLGSPLEMRVEQQSDRQGRYGDHFSFSEAGYPAIRIINTLEEFGNGSTQDVASAVEYPFLREAVQSIMLMTIAIADGPPPPRSISIRTTANNQPMIVWENVPEAIGYTIVLRTRGTTFYDGVLPLEDITSYILPTLLDGQYEALAIGAVGENGLIGRLSPEYILN